MVKRKEGVVTNHCTTTPNKDFFNGLFPCAVDFCGGSEGSEPALPPQRGRGGSGSAMLQPRCGVLELEQLSTASLGSLGQAQTHRLVLTR